MRCKCECDAFPKYQLQLTLVYVLNGLLAGRTARPAGEQTGLADSIEVGQGNRTEAGLADYPTSELAGRHTYRLADLLARQAARPSSVRFPPQYK